MDETQIIQGVALITNDQSPEIAEPGEESLNFPPPSVPAKRAAILHLGTGAIAAMGRNHLDAQQLQSFTQRIRIVALVPDQPAGEVVHEAGVKGGSDEVTSLSEAEAAHAERGRPERSATAMSFVPLPRLVGPTHPPLFWRPRRCRR